MTMIRCSTSLAVAGYFYWKSPSLIFLVNSAMQWHWSATQTDLYALTQHRTGVTSYASLKMGLLWGVLSANPMCFISKEVFVCAKAEALISNTCKSHACPPAGVYPENQALYHNVEVLGTLIFFLMRTDRHDSVLASWTLCLIYIYGPYFLKRGKNVIIFSHFKSKYLCMRIWYHIFTVSLSNSYGFWIFWRRVPSLLVVIYCCVTCIKNITTSYFSMAFSWKGWNVVHL